MTLHQPLIIPISEDEYELVQRYTYEWKLYDKPLQYLKVPEGFIYDGASVPRWLWSISGIRPDGLNRAASLLHDYLYSRKGILPKMSHMKYTDKWVPADHVWDRKEADRLFCRLLREAGVSKVKRLIAYGAVRIFGGSSW